MKHLTNPSVLRLGAYVVAGIIGIVMVVAGRIDAAGLEEWVTSAQTSLGTLLTLVAALAGANIDRTGSAPRVDVADLPTVREAVADVINGHATDALADVTERVDTAKHRLEDRATVHIEPVAADPRELLADMQRRIVATRAGRAAGD